MQEHNDPGRTRAPAEGSGQGVDIHQDSTLPSVTREGQHANALHGDVAITGTESTGPIEDDGAATTLYSHEDTEWTETPDEDSESAETEQLGETPTIDRSEDRGQQLQVCCMQQLRTICADLSEILNIISSAHVHL